MPKVIDFGDDETLHMTWQRPAKALKWKISENRKWEWKRKILSKIYLYVDGNETDIFVDGKSLKESGGQERKVKESK